MNIRRIGLVIGLALPMMLVGIPAQAAEPSAHDIAFMKQAHQVNLAEIAAGQVAWKKTTDPVVKNVAATLMRNHIHMDAALSQAARTLHIDLPLEPNSEQQELTARYEATAAGAFDAYFISTQVTAHQETQKLFSGQVAKGSDPAVSELAEKATPIIADQLEMLREAAE
ncbi:DUF4142 domain-containing protein [Actinoplanes sp. NPDC026670]|uniref:DUF4142 domain-containing protein n=1 Tax=Actinoplanes sp. NPDC026670 TaxID=3154700 RepID=UPI0033CE6D48